MLVAVPLFGSDVAPRFCFADRLLLAKVEDGAVEIVGPVALASASWTERLQALAGRGVDVVLCGGFNARMLPYARGLGLRVYWGLTGDAEALIRRLAAGELEDHLARVGCRRGGGGGRRGPGRGRGRWRKGPGRR